MNLEWKTIKNLQFRRNQRWLDKGKSTGKQNNQFIFNKVCHFSHVSSLNRVMYSDVRKQALLQNIYGIHVFKKWVSHSKL